MHHAAFPPHWVLAQMMNNANMTPHSVAAFYTGCTELVPLLGASTLLTSSNNVDLLGQEKKLQLPLWTNLEEQRFTPSSSNMQTETRMANALASCNSKGIKRQLDLGNSPRTSPVPFEPTKTSRIRIKRRPEADQDSSHSCEGPQNGHFQPAVKRALLRTTSPSPSPILPPPKLTHGNEWDHLSEEMWQKFMECKQSEDVFAKKMRLRDAIFHILQDTYSYCGLYVVGSSMNGFGCNDSDMDMCLMLTHAEIDQKNEATSILRQVHKNLKKCDFVKKIELIQAKVPILKFHDAISGVEVDFNVNNAVGIRNTHLLKCYSKMDWRVCPLILIIKKWAKIQDINDAKSMTVSSYSIVLMVIHYLQCGVTPAVLPCLHKMYPHKFLSNSDVRSLNLNEDLPPYHSQNKMSLGELLIGFLNYYSNRFK